MIGKVRELSLARFVAKVWTFWKAFWTILSKRHLICGWCKYGGRYHAVILAAISITVLTIGSYQGEEYYIALKGNIVNASCFFIVRVYVCLQVREVGFDSHE